MFSESVEVRDGYGRPFWLRTDSNFVCVLKAQGYSDRAIEEICRWYVSSTSKRVTARIESLKN